MSCHPFVIIQDSRAYYNILNQVAPKGDEDGIPAIPIDMSGLRVSVFMNKPANHIQKYEVMEPKMYDLVYD